MEGLKPPTKLQWSCHTCESDLDIDMAPTGTTVAATPKAAGKGRLELVKLLLEPKQPLIVIAEAYDYGDDDGRRYYYEEGTCPSNAFRSTLEVIEGNDEDPHGVFRYLDRWTPTQEERDKVFGLRSSRQFQEHFEKAVAQRRALPEKK